MLKFKLILFLMIFTISFVIGCQKTVHVDTDDPFIREDAFPDMSYENSSPRRRASCRLQSRAIQSPKEVCI